MANGCYALSTGGGPLKFTFKPTDLGTYLLYGEGGKFLAGSDGAGLDPGPSADAEWTVRKVGNGFTFTLPSGRSLAASGKTFSLGSPARFALETAKGCPAYPESAVNVSGDPHAGVTPYQEVRGYVDAHTHGMAFEFLGGRVHCGRPWHKYGAPYALRDCADHEQTQGYGALARDVLLRRPRARPGRLADVQGLARPQLADPRRHLLQVARAVLARRAAAVREPPGREQPAVPALSAQAQLLQRHGLHPAPGQGHVRVPGLHRRAVRRPRQGLLPDREDPVAGPEGDQRRQDGRGHGHRDQRAVRLHLQGGPRHRRPGLHRGRHRPPARRDAPARRSADGAGQQVRQRARRRGRRQRQHGSRRQRRQLPGDRHLLGHEALRAGRR